MLTRKKNNSIMPTSARRISQWLSCYPIFFFFTLAAFSSRFVSGVDAFFHVPHKSSLDHESGREVDISSIKSTV